MRTRLLFIVPVIAGAALLGACGSDDSGSSPERTAYLQAIKDADVTFPDDDAAVAAGEQACADLKSGKAMVAVAADVEGQDAGKGAAVVGAATGSLCRDQLSKLIPSIPGVPPLDE
ncbi:hypothetical protein nbrc107696_16670 [Gordonia spumicola]|uniref:DUF732 domain-containing protein n=1 Tax=Gordonia spumicola TaxID=589161 RepID=A0A7I9V800_9ACTN|nr:DUF732 domain-containing protein [Gordonia spumicola]GEE01221.1 hypothetical protein nbrc107696_16670 [Gordonia spumicola]